MDLPIYLRRGRVLEILQVEEYQLRLMEQAGTLRRHHIPPGHKKTQPGRKGYFARDEVLKLKQEIEQEGNGHADESQD